MVMQLSAGSEHHQVLVSAPYHVTIPIQGAGSLVCEAQLHHGKIYDTQLNYASLKN